MKWLLIAGSTIGHVAALTGLNQLHASVPPAPPTVISIVEIPEPPAEIQEAPAEPPPPPASEQAPPSLAAKATPSAAAEIPDAAPPSASPPSLSSMPDLGLDLSGGSGAGGIAVPSGGGGPARTGAAPERRVLGNSKPATKPSACSDAESKPKVLSLPKPGYTEQARAAGINGKVRVSITVSSTGAIESVQVVQALGFGLDEAAVAAAQSAQFEPAKRCGLAVSSTFTLSIKFSTN